MWHDNIMKNSKYIIMKKLLLFTAVVAFSLSSMAQGKSQKKQNTKSVEANKNQRAHTGVGKNNGHDDVYHAPQNTTAKYSKNTPAKVSESFTRDYPNAANVTWTKSQGYWVASFRDGIYRNSVRYSANGERSNITRRRLRL
jgi:hypothetical protein